MITRWYYVWFNLQRSIVGLKSPRLSPGIVMTGIVKCADKALTKWDKSRWGHGLLFKMTLTNERYNSEAHNHTDIHGDIFSALLVWLGRGLERVWVARQSRRVIDPENDIQYGFHSFMTWQMPTHCLFLRV